jgi:di/tricarboxylate transporter
MNDPHMLIAVLTLAGAAVLLVTNWIRGDLVAVLVMLTLMLTGVLDPADALSGLSSPVVVIIASMFVISEAIVHTGLAQRMGETIIARGGTSEVRLLALLMAGSALVGSFMSSTATAAIFIPITLAVAEKAGLNHRRLLIPLAAGALISGMMTLVATTPNIVINNALRSHGQEALSFFSFTPFGLAVLVLAIGFMVVAGRHLLSGGQGAVSRRRERSIEEILQGYDIQQRVGVLRVQPGSDMIDRSVARMQLGARHHINLIALHTVADSGRAFVPARPASVFLVNDILVVVAEKEAIDRFAETFQLERMELQVDPALQREFFQAVGVGEVMLTPESNLIGKSVREIGFHSRFRCQVLAIRRKGATLTTGFADEPLRFGDVLLACGAWEDILQLRDHRDQYILLNLPQDYREVIPARSRGPVAVAILAAMVGLLVFDLLPTVTAVLVATAALILFRCVDVDSCYRVIDWQTVLIIAGMLPLALALERTGAITLVTDWLLGLFAGVGPTGVLAVLFLVTVAIGLFLSNTPTAVLVAPMAVEIGLKMGIPPQACAMTVAIACSAAFISPLGSPVNMIVREPGGYTFMDYARVGVPLVALSLVATLVLIRLIYLR